MKNKGIIYCAISPKGKKYFGQTIQTLEKRKQRHIRDAKNGCNYRFHQALRKYNYNFDWIIVEALTENLNELEEKYIKESKSMLYDFGYNMTHGGDYTKKGGWNNSQESKDKIRNSLKDIKHTKERRKNISEAHKGKSFFAKNFGTQIELSKEDKDKIIEMHTKEYIVASEIADHFSFGQQFIRKVLQESGNYISYQKLRKLRNESKISK